jgi:beta-phosphoglucomutase-like phosphatase (HAD superfamily)
LERTVKIFFDVDGVLIDGWHSKPELRRPWDATIEQDLGIDKDAFREKFFGSAASNRAVIHAYVRGERDLKEALAATLPTSAMRAPSTPSCVTGSRRTRTSTAKSWSP